MTPLVIGMAFQLTGSFVGPLVYIGVVALIGAFSYSVILGDIHRLEVGRPRMPIDGIPAHQHPIYGRGAYARFLRPRHRTARRRPSALFVRRVLVVSRRSGRRAPGAATARTKQRVPGPATWITSRSAGWISMARGRRCVPRVFRSARRWFRATRPCRSSSTIPTASSWS